VISTVRGTGRKHEFATVTMDTLAQVTIISERSREDLEPLVQRAFAWFETVERICSRFDPTSEVMKLSRRIGKPVPVSTLLFELVSFALDLAERCEGSFDPTIGAELEQRGYATNYRTLEVVRSGIEPRGVSYRDVHLDHARRRITLRRPLVLDLNSVAKGLAIDLAAQELRELANFSIEAGGDLVARGHNLAGEPWSVGIQHPRADGLLAQTLHITDEAVCTSGDYERGQHVLDARTRQPLAGLASVTVVAPTALAADGLSTAAWILGPERGKALLVEQGVKAVLVTAEGAVESV
jgi:FAD:protein FMN transferase